MYGDGKSKLKFKNFILIIPVLLVVPFLVLFDTVFYFITRPSCLSCGNLLEFLKGASLTVAFLVSTGYTLRKKK